MIPFRKDGQVVMCGPISSLLDQVFSMETPEGWQYHWNVSKGLQIAETLGCLTTFAPLEAGVTVESIRQSYHDLDETYALTTDPSRPLLFVMLGGKPQLVDGWHRLFKAVTTGVSELSAYVLTEEEADGMLLLKLPPGQGIDWGQAVS